MDTPRFCLEEAIDTVRLGGGTVDGPTALPDGSRVAVCEDPQGAAFGVMQASRELSA